MIEVDGEYEITRRREIRENARSKAKADARNAIASAITVERRKAGRSSRDARNYRRDRQATDNPHCEVCGWTSPVGMEDMMPVHHIKPLSCGGTHETTNLILLCPNCHAIAHKLWPIHRITRIERDYSGPIDRNETIEAIRRATYSATTPKNRREVKRAKS